ncbi:MAG: LAGLIDADG family homing endonuclease, partial [Nanoarchaeota archaeon]|nr:LAGLIDADG family homing endonuclease [Nanoarchaeota archaeon]
MAKEEEEEESMQIEKAINQDDFLTDAKAFFETNRSEVGKVAKSGGKVVNIDFEDFSSHSPQLAEQLIDRPEETIQLLELSLEELEWTPRDARVRFVNISKQQEILIRNIRAKHLGKMIGIEGIVRKASEVRPQVTNAKFECPSCGTIISVLQIDKKFKEPSRCSCGRRGGFKEISKDMVDAQVLTVEESPENLTGGEQPKRMTIFLKEDLVDPRMEMRTTPGSRVKIIGVLKEIALTSSSGATLTRFDLAIEANNVIPMEESFEDIDITEDDEKIIRELAADPDLLDKMTKSIAPSIWGHSDVKKALALQLFGGVQKRRSDETKMRGDIHILLVGDPGVAKSVMLSFIASVAPKARYISGKSTTGAGITATVVKDEILKGWSLEAGAMVLANKGLVCIDEFDKMDDEDRSTMHEAMEQQCMLPDFKLMLSSGKYARIGNLVDDLIEKNKEKVYKGKDCEILQTNDVELLSTDFQNHFPLKASRVSRHNAPGEFVKIVLQNGREIVVTPEHPCWVTNNGKIETIPAENLKEKMFFPVPSGIKIVSENYKTENDLLCKILGYHITEGCYELNRSKKNGIQFWNNDKILINDYQNAIEKYFSLKTGITKRGKQFAVRVISKKVVEFLNNLDADLMKKGCDKIIPEKIMGLPDENIKNLIRALFDGDGTVTFQKRDGCRSTLVTENKILAEQVSDLLLRFEIQSSIFKDKNVWRLDISGQENLKKFLSQIGFLSGHKQERLKKYCETQKSYKTIRDVIPGCTDLINSIFKKLKISARKKIGHSIDLHVEKQRKFLQKLILIAEKYAAEKKIQDNEIKKDIENIKNLSFGYSRWVKIKKVSKIKNEDIKWVYDVTIEPHHTFISNGMILHNTVTI